MEKIFTILVRNLPNSIPRTRWKNFHKGCWFNRKKIMQDQLGKGLLNNIHGSFKFGIDGDEIVWNSTVRCTYIKDILLKYTACRSVSEVPVISWRTPVILRRYSRKIIENCVGENTWIITQVLKGLLNFPPKFILKTSRQIFQKYCYVFRLGKVLWKQLWIF